MKACITPNYANLVRKSVSVICPKIQFLGHYTDDMLMIWYGISLELLDQISSEFSPHLMRILTLFFFPTVETCLNSHENMKAKNRRELHKGTG